MEERKQIKLQVQKIIFASGGICREYALLGSIRKKKQEKTDWGREREKIKEMLLPFVREAVKKQLKEEREYYKSRPSTAAKQLETVFGAENLKNAVVRGMSETVYDRLEERIRREWIRKGR